MKILLAVVVAACLVSFAHAQTLAQPSSSSGSSFTGGAAGTSFQDVTETAAPANPAAGVERIYSDSTSHFLTCLTSGGGNCFAAGASSFPLTVSGTVTSGGIPCFTSTTQESSSGILNSNILPKGGGAGVCPTNSSITDNLLVTTAEFLQSANTCRLTADANIVSSGTAVTVCQFSLPAVSKVWYWTCNMGWVISAGTTPTLSIGVNASQSPAGAPTNGFASILTTNANAGVQGSNVISASGAINLLTSGTLTVSATIFQASSFGVLSASSSAGTFTITMTGTGTGISGLIKGGSGCTLN